MTINQNYTFLLDLRGKFMPSKGLILPKKIVLKKETLKNGHYGQVRLLMSRSALSCW